MDCLLVFNLLVTNFINVISFLDFHIILNWLLVLQFKKKNVCIRRCISYFLKQGTIGFEKHIDRCLELSEYLYTKIKNREGYEMVFHGQVCEEYF